MRYNAYKKLAHRAIVLIPEGVAAPDLSCKQIVRYKVSEQIDNLGASRALHASQQVTINGQNFPIASPSEGIASNAALAIAAAMYLGMLSQTSANASKRGVLAIADALKYLRTDFLYRLL